MWPSKGAAQSWPHGTTDRCLQGTGDHVAGEGHFQTHGSVLILLLFPLEQSLSSSPREQYNMVEADMFTIKGQLL